MRILHLSTHLNAGGITRYITQLVKPLSSSGVETFIISSGGNEEAYLQSLGAKTFTLNIKTKSVLNPKLYFALPKLLKFIREQKIDALHAHSRVTQVLGHFASKQAQIPMITTCHGYFKNRLGRKLLPAWGNHTVAISRPVQKRLIEIFKLPEKQVHLVSNGVNAEELRKRVEEQSKACIREKLKINSESILIGNISRLVEDKGHTELIKAFQKLSPKYSKLELLIVGSGKYEENLRDFARQSGLASKIHFWGQSGDISEPLRILDLFVFAPTFREGFGLNLAEALACNIPVITTDIWAINQIFEHKKTALLVPPKDSKALSEAIEELLLNSEKAKTLAKQGRELVEREYNLEKMAKGIYQVYEQALSNAS